MKEVGVSDVLDCKHEQKSEVVINTIIYQERPQKGLYLLASIIAKNFVVLIYVQGQIIYIDLPPFLYYKKSDSFKLAFISSDIHQI